MPEDIKSGSEALKMAIQFEKDGRGYYLKAKERVKLDFAKSILARSDEDRKFHKRYRKVYVAANIEKIRKASRKHYAENRERILIYQKGYQSRNRVLLDHLLGDHRYCPKGFWRHWKKSILGDYHADTLCRTCSLYCFRLQKRQQTIEYRGAMKRPINRFRGARGAPKADTPAFYKLLSCH